VRSAFDGVVSYAAGFTDYPDEIPLPDTAEDLAELGHWQLPEAYSDEEVVVSR
jgi:hypothetical protein